MATRIDAENDEVHARGYGRSTAGAGHGDWETFSTLSRLVVPAMPMGTPGRSANFLVVPL
jgi:hypothetical protein